MSLVPYVIEPVSYTHLTAPPVTSDALGSSQCPGYLYLRTTYQPGTEPKGPGHGQRKADTDSRGTGKRCGFTPYLFSIIPTPSSISRRKIFSKITLIKTITSVHEKRSGVSR